MNRNLWRTGLVALALVCAVLAPSNASAATRADGIFECTNPWTYVANVPSGYVIGNCPAGTHVHRTWKSDLTPNGYYEGGYVHGSFDGCGWVGSDFSRKVAEGTFGACADSASRPLTDFAWYTNDGDCPPNGCTDGSPWTTLHPCPIYANYRPWSTANRPTDYLRTVPPGGQLKWRYVTKYPSADGTGHYVMVRDTAAPSGQGNWGFVPGSCHG